MAGLADYPVAAVLRAEDFDRAAKFYSDVLGLKPVSVGGSSREGTFTAGDGSMFSVYERPGMPAPQNTTLGFRVPADKLEAVMDDLRGRGVVFQEYDIPEIGLKTVNGVATLDHEKAAWFLDSEGNILSLGTM